MKNVMFILGLLLIFSCFPNQDIIPPDLTVSPSDTTEISSISPVTFNILGFGNEELSRFKISTVPFVYSEDTSFVALTNSIVLKSKISIIDNIPELGEDSIITVTFKLIDKYNTTEIVRYLKVISGYGYVDEDSAKLLYGTDTNFFYSCSTKSSFSFSEITKTNIDLVFIYDATDGFVLASPNAFYISDKLNFIGLFYDATGRNQTKMNKFSTDFSQVDAKFLYYLTVSGSFINDNGGNGYGSSNLKANDVIAFETENLKKGMIKIISTSIPEKSITFKIKIQK